MMTDTAVQQMGDNNGQSLVTQPERLALIQKLSTKWTIDLSTRIENLAYEKSRGVKTIYSKMLENYCVRIQQACQNRSNSQQALTNHHNGSFTNQQSNPSQQQAMPMHSQPPLNPMGNQQTRFAALPPQQPSPLRMTNPQTSLVNNQPGLPNQVVRLRDPQKFNQTSVNTMSYAPSTSSMDLNQNYTPQQPPMTNPNLNDYLAQPPMLANRYPTQPSMNPRPRLPTNLSGGFPSQPPSNNSNDILHRFVVGNPSPNTMASSSPVPIINPSSGGDRLLQKILSSNNDAASNVMSLPNRQATSSMMPQPSRTASTTNSTPNNAVNSLRPSLMSQPTPPSPAMIVMHTSNVQTQPSPSVSVQQSPLSNNNNGSFSINTQAISQPPPSLVSTNSSTPLMNNYSSPNNRSATLAGSGSISSPDEETINLIKYLKDNLGKLQSLCQRFTNEGNQDKARNAQTIHQQMVQFINNPTYEALPNAKHIRDILERASTRSQTAPVLPAHVPAPSATVQQINDVNQFEKALTDYMSRDSKRRLFLSRVFVEPLNDVVNGVPHKKMRLDSDSITYYQSSPQINGSNSFSLLTQLNDELSLLPANVFSIERLPVSHSIRYVELDDEYLSKKGLILRCKLSEDVNPLIPPLRLRVTTRYPYEQPEVLSLTDTLPPKLEFTDGPPILRTNLHVVHFLSLQTSLSTHRHRHSEHLASVRASRFVKTIVMLNDWSSPQTLRKHVCEIRSLLSCVAPCPSSISLSLSCFAPQPNSDARFAMDGHKVVMSRSFYMSVFHRRNTRMESR